MREVANMPGTTTTGEQYPFLNFYSLFIFELSLISDPRQRFFKFVKIALSFELLIFNSSSVLGYKSKLMYS